MEPSVADCVSVAVVPSQEVQAVRPWCYALEPLMCNCIQAPFHEVNDSEELVDRAPECVVVVPAGREIIK